MGSIRFSSLVATAVVTIVTASAVTAAPPGLTVTSVGGQAVANGTVKTARFK
jgi:hypothetical protein